MRSRRILVGGGVVLALLAVVALASRAHTASGGRSAPSLNPDLLLEYVLLLVTALALVLVPVGLYLKITGRDYPTMGLPARGNWGRRLIIVVTILCIVLFARLEWKLHHQGHKQPLKNPASGVNKVAPHKSKPAPFEWTPVAVVGGLMLVVVIAGAVMLREKGQEERLPGGIAEELAEALDRTIADLEAEPDPRKAVIAAYAQMERALARAGLPRREAETPREYLGRVLPEVGAGSRSVERLTALFERARFSPHEIDAAMKAEAISALATLRDELRGER
jgi:hypothetical protein